MDIEIEKAMRGAARRKLTAGIEPRDPVRDARRFQEQSPAPRWLIVAAGVLALLVIGLALSYLANVPPAHIVIVALLLFWIFGWRTFRRGKH